MLFWNIILTMIVVPFGWAFNKMFQELNDLDKIRSAPPAGVSSGQEEGTGMEAGSSEGARGNGDETPALRNSSAVPSRGSRTPSLNPCAGRLDSAIAALEVRRRAGRWV